MSGVTEESDREATLRVLIDLAMADDPASCYEGGRAMRLLRSQSSPEELEGLGIDRDTIRLIWPEGDDG
jgi:hypothetical protein